MRAFQNDRPDRDMAPHGACNVLPQGIASDKDLLKCYRAAVSHQQQATDAWIALMHAHLKQDGSWSAVLHCAEASGIPHDNLRKALLAEPSTLSRWFKAVAQPARMLRKRLGREVDVCSKHWHDQLGQIINELDRPDHAPTEQIQKRRRVAA